MKEKDKERIQNQFGAFCTKVLKNEMATIYNEYTKQSDFEKPLSELNLDELLQIAVVDEYFSGEHIFQVLDKSVIVMGDLLADAIANLPEKKQEVILMSYFLGMNDREISDELNMIRQTVSGRRNATLNKLREYLEKEGFEWGEK